MVDRVPSERSRIRRKPDRGAYDRDTIHAILDEALVAHVGFCDAGQPYVLPMLQARVDDTLYLHGSSASRLAKLATAGVDLCVTATLIDGLVLARSAFHHSVNYRSVVVLGRATTLDDPGEKARALERFVERIVPGRWANVRWPTEKELRATAVIALPLEEASAKVRDAGVTDDDEDLELDVWAGVIPLGLKRGAPIADELLDPATELPSYLHR